MGEPIAAVALNQPQMKNGPVLLSPTPSNAGNWFGLRKRGPPDVRLIWPWRPDPTQGSNLGAVYGAESAPKRICSGGTHLAAVTRSFRIAGRHPSALPMLLICGTQPWNLGHRCPSVASKILRACAITLREQSMRA